MPCVLYETWSRITRLFLEEVLQNWLALSQSTNMQTQLDQCSNTLSEDSLMLWKKSLLLLLLTVDIMQSNIFLRSRKSKKELMEKLKTQMSELC